MWLVTSAVVSLLLLLTRCQASECPISQAGMVHVIHNNTTEQYSSLQDAVDFIVNLINDTETPTVCLAQGDYQVTKQLVFGNSNIRLIGVQGSTITCDYDPLPFEDGYDYTWHFNQSQLVHLEMVNFTSCPYPFRVIAVQNLTITGCLFRNFSEAVLDIFNCALVQLKRSYFYNNSGTGVLFETFRGNTGAVALGYHYYPDYLNQPHVIISHCEFINNSALATSKLLSPERAVSNSVFTGRGGGLGIFVGDFSRSVILDMIDCEVIGNFGRLFGGGIFIIINSYDQLFMTFQRINIIGNRVETGGGGVQLSFLSATNTYVPPDTIVFQECNFVDNVAVSGGGIYIFTSFVGTQGIYFKLDRCNFTSNRGYGNVDEFGAAVAVSLVTIFQQRVTAERHDIIDCTFVQNSGRNGIVSIGYSPIRFSGSNEFVNNNGASIRIVGSLADFYDNLTFIDNTDNSEGSLSMLSFGQMRIHKGLQMVFDGNRGRFGASITVITPDSPSTFSNLLYNSACFATYEEPLLAPTEWENISVVFESNTAVLGSALYFTRLDHCSWFSQNPPYFRQNYVRDWPIWKLRNNTNTGYFDAHNSDHYFGTHATEINVNLNTVDSWPGKHFQMSVTGSDQFHQTTSTNARLFQVSEHLPIMEFNPEIVVVAGSSGLLNDKFSMTYSVFSVDDLQMLVNHSSVTIGMEEPFQTLSISAAKFTIRPDTCPGGYQLREVTASNTAQRGLTCQCLDIPEIVGCEEDQDSVIIKHGFWAEYVNDQSPNLFFHPCPAGYCQCTLNSSLGPERCVYKYTHSDQDLQCNAQRQGLLCGGCRNNSGVSVLLDKCVSCSNGYITLVLVLIILDAIVFVVISLIDRPLPQWLYPFIFYVQMAPFVSSYFPESFQSLSVYMTYLKSALGFYFVYDFCLLDNLPPLTSYFIRYIPSIVSVMVGITIRISRKYFLKKKSLKHHGYWLIVILLYPNVVHTSLSILNCPQIPKKTGSLSLRWFVDSNVKCFDGWHVPLALLSIAVLFVCLTSIGAVTVLAIKKPEVFKKYIPPLIAAYKDQCQWWSGLELSRRLLLLILLVAFPKNTVYAILLLVITMATYSYLLPYKSVVANLVEMLLLLNLTVLMLIDATPLIRESLFTFGLGVSISPISWLLFAFYYLPVVLLVCLLAGLGIHKLVRLYKNKARDTDIDCDVSPAFPVINENREGITSQSIHMELLDSVEGEAIVVDFVPNYKPN